MLILQNKYLLKNNFAFLQNIILITCMHFDQFKPKSYLKLIKNTYFPKVNLQERYGYLQES